MVPKRTLIIAITGMAFLLVAALALAAFLSSKQTASSSFTAAAFGDVSIGNAETTALFDLTDMQPGDAATMCFVATVTDGAASGDWRLYSGVASGDGLEDYLRLIVRVEAVTIDGTPPGFNDCVGFSALTTPVASEVLSAYAASTSSFVTGDSLGVQTSGVVNSVRVMLSFSLPDTPEVAANASGLSASTSWIIENQT